MKDRIVLLLLLVCLIATSLGSHVVKVAAADPSAYLYFTTSELDELKSLTSQPSHSDLWVAISTWAGAHINDTPPTEPTTGFIGYWDAFQRSGVQGKVPMRQFVETMAFMYAMTDDTTYAEAAKLWLMEAVSWNSWEGGGTYGQTASVAIMMATFGYDVLGNYLTPAERAQVETVVAREATDIDSYWTDWEGWSGYDTFAYPNASGLRGVALELAALTFPEDANANSWDSKATDMINDSLDTHDALGSFEGIGYVALSMETLLRAIDPMKRVKGIDLFNHPFLMEEGTLFTYLTYDGKPLQLEDILRYEGLPAQLSHLYRLASEFNDGHAQWYANTYAPQESIWSYIWKKDVVSLPPTSLPLVKVFPREGYLISRSGWGDNDLVFTFKSGGSLGHAHPSQNEFGIYYQGELITGGPGYTSNQVTDGTWTSNCILVNGLGQAQEPGDNGDSPPGTRGLLLNPEIVPGNYIYILGDASAVYTETSGVGNLSTSLRHIVWLENPNLIVIYDQLAAPTPSEFSWLLNTPPTSWSGATPGITISGNEITLGQGAKVIIVEPAAATIELSPWSNPLMQNETNRVIVNSPIATESEFLTAFFPEGVLPMEEVRVGNVLGLIVSTGDTKDLILFSADGGPVDEYIELGGNYTAADNGSYLFQSTGVRVQFQGYQVLRLTTGSPPPTEDWDVNSDGSVNVLDLIRIGQHQDETGPAGWIREDVNKDGTVSVLDIILVGQHWTG